jgi:hypothetical protein
VRCEREPQPRSAASAVVVPFLPKLDQTGGISTSRQCLAAICGSLIERDAGDYGGNEVPQSFCSSDLLPPLDPVGCTRYAQSWNRKWRGENSSGLRKPYPICRGFRLPRSSLGIKLACVERRPTGLDHAEGDQDGRYKKTAKHKGVDDPGRDAWLRNRKHSEKPTRRVGMGQLIPNLWITAPAIHRI